MDLEKIHKVMAVETFGYGLIFIFTAKDTEGDKAVQTRADFYQLQLNNNSASEVIILEGHHYLHWTRYKEISEKALTITKELKTE
jgi:hypothetical protein